MLQISAAADNIENFPYQIFPLELLCQYFIQIFLTMSICQYFLHQILAAYSISGDCDVIVL